MSAFKDLSDTAKEAEEVAFAESPIPLDFLKMGFKTSVCH